VNNLPCSACHQSLFLSLAKPHQLAKVPKHARFIAAPTEPIETLQMHHTNTIDNTNLINPINPLNLIRTVKCCLFISSMHMGNHEKPDVETNDY